MTTYQYARTYANNKWNINNPDDVNASNQSVTLAERIKTAFPAKIFTVKLDATTAYIDFEIALTPQEKTTLDTVVADHENASGTPTQVDYLYLTSPDGTAYKASITNAGAWNIEAV